MTQTVNSLGEKMKKKKWMLFLITTMFGTVWFEYYLFKITDKHTRTQNIVTENIIW